MSSTQLSNLDPRTDLYKKICQAPAGPNRDKLHAAVGEALPHALYEEEGLWRARIDFISPQRPITVAPHTYNSLDDLCAAELQRRFPNYRTLSGIKAWCKDHFPFLARLWMGDNRYKHELTRQEINNLHMQIAYSAMNRPDMTCRPEIVDPTLHQALQIHHPEELETHHRFARYSPLNGNAYRNEQQGVTQISHAVVSSNDRTANHPGNLRVIEAADGTSIAYTGRVDTPHKALEQATFLFLQEIGTQSKGIRRDPQTGVYHFDYVVNSMLSIPAFWSRESLICPSPERDYLEKELSALDELRKRAVAIVDPATGHIYQVRCNPILFTRSTNASANFEEFLPPFFSGEERSLEVSRAHMISLQAIAERKILDWQDRPSHQGRIPTVRRLLNILQAHYQKKAFFPEEEILVRDLLCKLLDLPIVYHCKSSTDRTSVAIALSSALQHWISLGLAIPENPCLVLQDWRFQELFTANWMAGHQVSRYARAAEGTVSGRMLNKNNLGLSMSRDIMQNPMIQRLLPKRYLTAYPTWKKVIGIAACILFLYPLLLSITLPITLIRYIGYACTLGKRKDLLGPLAFMPLFLPFTLLVKLTKLFPDQVLNERSPQVGARGLLSNPRNITLLQ